jgi:hypothetical protein
LYTDELEAILETSGCDDLQKTIFAPEILQVDTFFGFDSFASDNLVDTLTSLSTSTTNTNQLRKRWTGFRNAVDIERGGFYVRVNPESPPVETVDPSTLCGNAIIDTNYGEQCDNSAIPVYPALNDGTCLSFNPLYEFGSISCGAAGTSDACLIDESQCVYNNEQLGAVLTPECKTSYDGGNRARLSASECVDGSKTINCQVPVGCENDPKALQVFCKKGATYQVPCFIKLEEPFPIFTGFNILIVALILCGYYLIRRKN